jgi:hypothetical protein
MTFPYLAPPPETATDRIDSPADLGQRWRALLKQLGIHDRVLYFVFVGPDRCMIKNLHEVEDVPRVPDEELTDRLLSGLREVLDGRTDLTVAFLLTRRGRGPISASDVAWATALTSAARRHGVPIEPTFRAHDQSVVLVEPAVDQVR